MAKAFPGAVHVFSCAAFLATRFIFLVLILSFLAGMAKAACTTIIEHMHMFTFKIINALESFQLIVPETIAVAAC